MRTYRKKTNYKRQDERRFGVRGVRRTPADAAKLTRAFGMVALRLAGSGGRPGGADRSRGRL